MKTFNLSLLATFFFASILFSQPTNAQEKISTLPYYEVPGYPEGYTPGNVAGRLLDGLGFRFYWATEGLTEKDLEYQPSEKARTTGETIDHIYGLTRVILNAPMQQPNASSGEENLSFEETRKRTLENIQKASEMLKNADAEDMESFLVIFQAEEDKTYEYPFWNLLNGPIADAIYHTGQVVSFRRSSGNPIDPKVRMFLGKKVE